MRSSYILFRVSLLFRGCGLFQRSRDNVVEIEPDNVKFFNNSDFENIYLSINESFPQLIGLTKENLHNKPSKNSEFVDKCL